MKKYFLIISSSLFIIACNNKSEQSVVEEDTSTALASHYIWQSSLNDSTGKLEWFPMQPISEDSLQPKNVVDVINKTNLQSGYYSKVKLEFIRTSHDTVYLKIPDATYLTQQMGSSGATMFLSGVVYTLTGLDSLNYINFDFEEGDHAGPGTYSRESFKDQ